MHDGLSFFEAFASLSASLKFPVEGKTKVEKLNSYKQSKTKVK